jgi:hypothetical protein
VEWEREGERGGREGGRGRREEGLERNSLNILMWRQKGRCSNKTRRERRHTFLYIFLCLMKGKFIFKVEKSGENVKVKDKNEEDIKRGQNEWHKRRKIKARTCPE